MSKEPVITREEYCRFSLPGRLRLLNLYGSVVSEMIYGKKGMIIFKMDHYYVMVIKDIESGEVREANPIWSADLMKMYSLL